MVIGLGTEGVTVMRARQFAGPTVSGPFLTEIDPQAAVKGSRDPLGIQTIWSRLGRHVVGNLTTVTTSARDFTTLMLGYHFAERAAALRDSDGDLNVFLRWEQLAAHARFRVNGDGRVRGIERVKRAVNEGGRVRIGVDPRGFILSNQRTYGLWGLYTGPARASGLVEGEPTRLTPTARDLVERVYLPVFTKEGFRNADSIVMRLVGDGWLRDESGSDKNLLHAVARVLSRRLRAPERGILRKHLLFGDVPDRTNGRQAAVASALGSTLGDRGWALSPNTVLQLAKACRAEGVPGQEAAYRLERVRVAEALLAPAAALFDFLLGCDGQGVAQVTAMVRGEWGDHLATVDPSQVAKLAPELDHGTDNGETARRWIRLAGALSEGLYDEAVQLLMEQNALVMKARAASGPWVDLAEDRLRVRYRDERPGSLPGQQALISLWRHPYFLDSLRSIAWDLRP